MSDRLYNQLKWIVMIVLPGIATLYAALSGFWDFPKVVEVVGTINAVVVFLALILGVQKARYQANEENYDGTLHVDERAEQDKLWLALSHEALDEVKYNKEVSLRVERSR